MLADEIPDRNDSDDQNVHTGGTECAIFLVVVEAPNLFDRLGLGFQLERRKLLGEEELVESAEKRLPEGLL